MALINYVEPISMGDVFTGFGFLLLSCVFAYLLYKVYIKFSQYIDLIINREAKYEILEETFLDKIGKAKGIDLNQELVRRKMFDGTKKKSFRRKVEEQIYEDMFGKETQ